MYHTKITLIDQDTLMHGCHTFSIIKFPDYSLTFSNFPYTNFKDYNSQNICSLFRGANDFRQKKRKAFDKKRGKIYRL